MWSKIRTPTRKRCKINEKSDLKNGAVVLLRNGDHYFKMDKILISLGKIHIGYMIYVDSYLEDLKHRELSRLDIMKVNNNVGEGNNALFTYSNVDPVWTWERKETPKLTDDEKAFLKMLNPKWKWIVRDEAGLLKLFSKKPCKKFTDRQHLIWKYNAMGGNANTMWQLLKDDMFSFIKNEDEEPYNIEELLKEGE